MNKKIGIIGSAINAFTVLAFAVCMLIDFTFGSYFVCIFLALSFVMMISAFEAECLPENKAAGKAALVFSAILPLLLKV